MNEESNPSMKERLKKLLRPYFLVAILVAFILGAGASTLLADTQNKVSAAYNSGLEQGQSAAELSYNSLIKEEESEFSSQLAQQKESFESEIQEKYDTAHRAGLEVGREQGYLQGQSEAQSKINQLESTIAAYEQRYSSSKSSGSTGYRVSSTQTSTESTANNTWETGSDYEPEPQGGIVYWTPNGESYHSTKNCSTLKRSKTISSGTVSEAIASGHGDPCNVCN